MVRLGERHKLQTNYAYYGDRHRAQIESVAHELAHGLDLAGRPVASSKLKRVIHKMGDRAADQHELRVQRVEVTALRKLGMNVHAKDLARASMWRRKDWSPLHGLNAPLTKRERSGVRRFVRLVKEA